MKKLTKFILSAAIVPALALSTTAMAEKHDAMKADAGQRNGEQQMNGKPAGAFYADDVIGKTVKHRGADEDVGERQLIRVRPILGHQQPARQMGLDLMRVGTGRHPG